MLIPRNRHFLFFPTSNLQNYNINQVLLYDGDKLFEYISSEIRLKNDNLPAIELLENCHIFCLKYVKGKERK